ncbi:PilZ domain-containing protein [Tardiphaga sp. 804_B3_N1_9]|uniref:PilZ domain-containing protein n=1 Tax=Tardiphaga TaxID=1395974 RepID=UPI0015866DA8|nr:PilZ domain-containing protein [Tardiphaga robiniae]NUU43679.1 PilZ domain-containing protein [Tardiphaga robiniae]
MDERRKNVRDKVIYGAVASKDQKAKECVVRDISEDGARIEFGSGARLPKDELTLNIARKGRSFLARIVWWRDNIVGVAFTDPPVEGKESSDIEERLRKSEKKKRELQKQIQKLLGQ